MTIYFKDGTALNVSKIVFMQNAADLYFADGSMRTYPVEKIDLRSSGIPRPVGTYGQTNLSPIAKKKQGPRKNLVADPKRRQTFLREEWDRAEQSAVAINDIGPIRQGDIVKISNQSETSSEPKKFGDYDLEQFPEEIQEQIQEKAFKVQPDTRDNAFVVIYLTPAGTFGKRLFDAATFHSNFKMNEKSKTAAPLPISVKKPSQESSSSKETEKTVAAAPKPSPVQETIEPSKNEKPIQSENESRIVANKDEEGSIPMVPLTIFVGIAAAGGALFIYSRKRKKPFLDISRFKQFEQELVDFELEIWLKHGRTMDQLLEICTKKFYQDQPNALAVALKMLKGWDRAAIIQSISRQNGLSIESANQVYFEMQQRMDWIREAIKNVSARTGLNPAHQSGSDSLKTITDLSIAPVANQIITSPRPVVSETEISDPEISPPPQMISSVSQSIKVTQTAPGGMPLYLRNVMKNLGDLSD